MIQFLSLFRWEVEMFTFYKTLKPATMNLFPQLLDVTLMKTGKFIN